jgi:hypothetical protein
VIEFCCAHIAEHSYRVVMEGGNACQDKSAICSCGTRTYHTSIDSDSVQSVLTQV